MKKISLFILFFVSLIFAKAQNIGIGESNFTPDGSSILEIKSTSKGLLIPRMTKDQRDAIVNPAFGLVIFQIDNNPGIYFNSGTSFVPTWDKIVIEEEITDMHQAVTITGQDYLVLTGQQITAQLINLGAHVTGVLPLTKGGTGATTAADARTNLGLGNSAVLNVGTTAGTVAAGDHAHANYASSSHTHATHTRGTGLTGSNYDGSSATTWAVDFAGSGTATTVSRSDHNHTGTYDNYANWKLQGSGLNESNVTSGTTINITGSGATTVTKSGNTVTISSTDNNSTYTASNGITLNVANFELTGQALALHNLATNGLIVRTGSGTVNGRTITWSGNGGSITNGDGVAGNPTISLNIGTGATQVAAGNHTHDAADVITGEFNRARVRRMTSADTRGTNPDPQTYEPAIQADFKQNTTDGLADGGTYHGVVSFRPYGSTTDFSGGQMHQMGFTDNGNLWMRKSTGIASWGSWQKLLTSTDIGTISGTQNYISKFTSSNSLGNSLLFDNGTSIGIGTATPGATNKLDVSYTTGSSGGKGINVNVTGNAVWSSPDVAIWGGVANSNASIARGLWGQATSASASTGRNWGVTGYADNGGTNVGVKGYVTSTSGQNAGILGVLIGFESFDESTTMTGNWAGFFSGPVKTTGQFTSSLATGTSPFNVTSTTVNTNLNADLLDGNHASAFQTALTNPVTGTGSNGHVSYWNGATTQTYDSDGNFFWDATNNRLGLGTSGPSQKLHITGGNILNEGILYQNTSLGQGSGAHGISWYNPSFYTWFDYMAPAGATNSPSGTAAPSDASANVTTWARRFNIENVNGYGWLFESGANASGSAPTVKFAISSNTGTFHSTGNANIDGTVNAGSYAVLGTGINGGYYQDATNGAYRSIVAASTTNGYYFQTNTGAATTMYVGLGGLYNGNVGIGTNTPSTKLEVNGQVKITGGSPGFGKVLTSDASGLATWQPLGGVATSGTITSGNWYRIASNAGNRANAEFTLRDYISGGGHSTLTFRVGTSYNDASGVSFTLLNHSRYGSVTFTKVRVLQATTYDPQYLEVYCVRDGSVDFSIYDNLQSAGWVPIAWTLGSIPGGYTAREFDVDNLFVIGDYDDRFTINRGGNVGIGTTSLTNTLRIHGATGLRISDPANVYSSNIVFGNPGNNWNSGIRVYDNGDAELRIWHMNALGQIVIATGYNGDQSTVMPTDGLFIDQNKVGIGYPSPASATGKLLVNGNVGIGTTTPGESLDVSGNIKSSGIVYWGDGLVRTENRANAGLQGNAGAKSGFFETSAPSPATSWPTGATSWWHMMDVRHSNNTNNYAMQFSGSFFDQKLYFRKTNNNASQPWSQIPVAVTGSISCYTSTVIYSDNNIDIQWDGSNYQPQFRQKMGSSYWWDVTWNIQDGNGTQYRDGDDIYATNTTWYYFSDSGTLNTSLNIGSGSGSSYGSDGSYWLGYESDTGTAYSAYKIEIFRRGGGNNIFHNSYSLSFLNKKCVF